MVLKFGSSQGLNHNTLRFWRVVYSIKILVILRKAGYMSLSFICLQMQVFHPFRGARIVVWRVIGEGCGRRNLQPRASV